MCNRFVELIERPLKFWIQNELKHVQTRLTDLFEGHSAVIIEDYAKGMISSDLAKWAIEFFNDKGIFVAVDPGRKVPAKTYTGANLLKPNFKESISWSRAWDIT